MSTVTGFATIPTSSGFLTYTVARLSCGHSARVTLKSSRGRCWQCQAEQDLKPVGHGTTCACGSQAFIVVYSPKAEIESDRITKIGDEIACETCASHAAEITWLQALDASTVFRARYSPRWGGQYHLYRRDPSSPSGHR